jgi:hypothetical protein
MQLGQAFQARRNDNTARTTTPQPATREEQVPVVSGVAVITMPDGSRKMVLASEAHALAANESASQDDIENDTDEAGANVLPAGGQEDVEHGAHEAVASVLPAGGQDEVSGEKAEETAAEGATTNETPQAVCGESITLPSSPSVVPAPLQDVTNMSASVHAKEQRPIDNRDDEQRECERLKLEIARLQSLVATVVAERDHFKNELTALKDRVRARLESLTKGMQQLQSDVTEDGYHEKNAEYENGSTDEKADGGGEANGLQKNMMHDEDHEDPGSNAKRGADTLKHVSRACGEPLEPPEKLVSMSEALSSGEATLVAIAALSNATDSTVRGVELGKITKDICRRFDSPRIDDTMFVEWLTEHAPAYRNDGKYREFVMDDAEAKYASPLCVSSSEFARAHNITLTVAARALESNPSELEVASHRVAAMPAGARRMCQARGVYLYTIKIIDSDILFVYVGESVDVERRMNDHIDAIFEPDKADGGMKKQRQGGHNLARAEIAGSPSAVEFDARVLMALNEDSAFELAMSYLAFCRKNSKFLPKTSDGILEVARAIGAVGFLAEAMFTVKYNSLNSESTATRIGMNISQPGIIHTSSSTKPSQLSLQAYRELSTGKAFKCGKCHDICTGKKYAHGADSSMCASCYESQRPAFTCVECGEARATGERYKGENSKTGLTGVLCKPCYKKRYESQRPAFTCVECGEARATGERFKGENSKTGLTGVLCKPCYKKQRPAFVCVECEEHFDVGAGRHLGENSKTRTPGFLCRKCKDWARCPQFECVRCKKICPRGTVPSRDENKDKICRNCYGAMKPAQRA